ncbi:MAG: OmpH family outer membrane protein, partial [Bacteroidota bacterium]
ICRKANVQAQKFGYMNYNNLIVEMTETKAADAKLQTYQQQLANAFETKAKAFQEEFIKAQTIVQEGGKSPKEVQAMEAEFEQKRQALAKEEQELQQKILAKREELYGPVFEKVNQAVQAVGKEGGYIFIFNESTGLLLYDAPADDVTPLVKAKLGM